MGKGLFRRLARWIRDHRIGLISLIILLIFVFGYLGLDRLYASTPSVPHTFPDRIYGIFQILRIAPGLSINNPTWELEIARWLAIFLIGYSVFTVAARLSSRELGLLSLKLGRDHVVVCGFTPLAVFLAGQYVNNGARVVMVGRPSDEGPEPPEGAIVLKGDTAGLLLKDAQLSRAKLLYCVEDDDALNADLLGYAYEVIGKDRSRPLDAMVHIVDPVLCNLIRAKLFRLSQRDVIRTEFFNMYQNAGRELLRRHPPFPRDAPSPPPVHILVMGVGRMGESLLVNIVKEWRGIFKGTGRKVAITILDREAGIRLKSLVFRYPPILDYADIRAIDADLQPSVLSGLPLPGGGEGGTPVTIAYVCLADTVLGLSAALVLHEKLKGTGVPVIVRTRSDRGFTSLLSRMDTGSVSPSLLPFPEFPSDTDVEDLAITTREQIARAVHDEYLVLLQREGLSNPVAEIPWSGLSEEMKAASRDQADDIIRKIEMIGCDIEHLTDWDEPLFRFTDEEIEQLAQLEHIRWMKERVLQGWQPGAERDDRRKIHPSIVPWEDLSEIEREKDRNAVRTLPATLFNVDLRIVRR